MSIEKEKLKISVVSYLNSKPFIYGFRKANFNSIADIELDIPSACAEKLLSEKVDIGLVPVAILTQLSSYFIISDYCIGSDGPVDSVLLLSNQPMDKIKNIFLDYQSRTSVLLTRVLSKFYWNIAPLFLSSDPSYENLIEGDTAGVVIGDRAILLKNKFKYCYDLSDEWKKFTGLPFVFAVWTARNQPDSEFVLKFNAAIAEGMKLIPEIAKKEKTDDISEEFIYNYLTESIDFDFDETKKKALTLFLEYAKSI